MEVFASATPFATHILPLRHMAGGIRWSAAFSLVCQRDSTADEGGGGFELGSGMFIHSVLPEAATEFLRKVAVQKGAGAAVGQ